MKTDIWMPIYIGDYLKDTRHLNTEEHGAYFLIMMELWNKGGKIKKSILPIISLKNNDYFFKTIWPSIEEFFLVKNDGFVTQKRITKELKASMKRRKAAKDNGKKGGRPITRQKPIGLQGVNPAETSSPSPSPSETSKPIKTFLSDSTEYRLAELLFTEIRKNNPDHKQPNLQTWAKHIDLLIRKDGKQSQDIGKLIKWVQADSFEQVNVLSTDKLRKRYDQLTMKMKKDTKGGNCGSSSRPAKKGKYSEVIKRGQTHT